LDTDGGNGRREAKKNKKEYGNFPDKSTWAKIGVGSKKQETLQTTYGFA